MSDRVEVTAGPGIVVRYGGIVVWTGPDASPALLSFLAQSARNLGPSPRGGRQIADHIANVLRSRDPEPHVPFITLGPSEHGWAALLHGPVQVWDGARWLAPTPSPGWLQAIITPQPAITVGAAGMPSTRALADVPWDLEAGVVPGGGFILLPDAVAGQRVSTGSAAMHPLQRPAQAGPREAAGTATGTASGATGAPPEAAGATAVLPSVTPSVPPTTTLSVPGSGPATTAGAGGPGRGPEEAQPGSAAGSVPEGRPASGPPASGPVVAGVRCSRGHFNHPRATRCAECGVAITGSDRVPVSGPRPSLGALVLDDGTIVQLDRGYVLGAAPERDPTVTGGLARPLRLDGEGISPAHAEIRLSDWDVVLVDRGSERGTFLYEPEATEWSALPAYHSHVLRPGTHLALAQRVLTFTSPWPG